jgi:3-deoxy-D-manno-octulosonic acid kinase
MDLPVPTPIAARVRRQGIRYTADIITGYLADTRSFESIVLNGTAVLEQWSEVGRTLRRFHDHGVNHTDLNIRNILLDENEKVFLIDFDKGEFRRSGSWQASNLRRLKRSLMKLELETGTTFDAKGWLALERGYESAR